MVISTLKNSLKIKDGKFIKINYEINNNIISKNLIWHIKHLLSVGRIKGYATDVLQSEYTKEKSIFDGVENVIVTPHIAGTSPEAQEKTYKRVLEKYENNSWIMSKS